MTREPQPSEFPSDIRENTSNTPVVGKKKPVYYKQVAKNLHEAAFIYALYGALDGLSLSYSMIKYCFDVLNTNNKASTSDLMHDWMSTPSGALVAATEAITIISFSLIANKYKDNDPNAFKRYTASLWPYLRDAMKGLKNGYKGIRSSMIAANFLAGQNLNYMIVPAGIFLGSLSVLNRIWYRRMTSLRKDMTGLNDDVLKYIKKTLNWEGEHCDVLTMEEAPTKKNTENIPFGAAYIFCKGKIYYANKLFNQFVELEANPKQIANLQSTLDPKPDTRARAVTHEELARITACTNHKYKSIQDAFNEQNAFLAANKYKGFASQFYSGFIDGLYLYMGVLGVSVMAPQLFVAMAALCVAFTVICMATRVYEEYEYQKKLWIGQDKIEFAICSRQLEACCFEYIQALVDGQDVKTITEKFASKHEEFLGKRTALSEKMASSTISATLSGLRYGLAAYSAIASLLFAAATIYAVCCVAVPPLLIVSAVVSGLVCLIGFTTYSLVQNHYNVKKLEEKPKELEQLREWLKQIDKLKKEVDELELADVKTRIAKSAALERPQDNIQEFWEVCRSLFSGVAKGQKSIEYIFNSLQEPDEQGHYQDTPVMLGMAVLSSAAFSVVLALRAFARGFGKPKLGEEGLGDTLPAPVNAGIKKKSPGSNTESALPRAEPELPRVETELPHVEPELPPTESALPNIESESPDAQRSLTQVVTDRRADAQLESPDNSSPHPLIANSVYRLTRSTSLDSFSFFSQRKNHEVRPATPPPRLRPVDITPEVSIPQPRFASG